MRGVFQDQIAGGERLDGQRGKSGNKWCREAVQAHAVLRLLAQQTQQHGTAATVLAAGDALVAASRF